MFSDMDSNDFAKLGRLVGIVLFVASFFLPAVTSGYAISRVDYLFASDAYHGWACAAMTLFGSLGLIASLFGSSRPDAAADFFFVVSGWITPLVFVFAFFPVSNTAKRIVATTLPFLLVVPLLFFASPESGWGPGPFRPLIGHYVWTVGCLLIFTPQYAGMLGATSKEGSEAPDED
jgi:hypothetical protein